MCLNRLYVWGTMYARTVGGGCWQGREQGGHQNEGVRRERIAMSVSAPTEAKELHVHDGDGDDDDDGSIEGPYGGEGGVAQQ